MRDLQRRADRVDCRNRNIGVHVQLVTQYELVARKPVDSASRQKTAPDQLRMTNLHRLRCKIHHDIVRGNSAACNRGGRRMFSSAM